MSVFAFGHPKGGVGKTTSSAHITAELEPDIIIDIDIGGGLHVINNLRPDDKKWNIITIKDKDQLIATVRKFDEAGKKVLIDCGGFDADINRIAVAISDVVIVPANDSVTELVGLSLFDRVLAEINSKTGQKVNAHILLCKTNPNQKHFPEFDEVYAQVKNMGMFKSRLSYRTGKTDGFQKSLFKGLGITEIRHGRASAAGKEVRAVVQEMLELAAKENE